MKDFFPLKVLIRPGEVFSGIAAGRTGWAWPLGLFALSVLSSAAMLAWAPRVFLAATAAGLPPTEGTFISYLLSGLAGGALFSAFSCALLAGFCSLLAGGRLMLRVPLPFAAAALYGFFFLALRGAPGLRPVGWAALFAAAALAIFSAWRLRAAYPALLKAFFALSVFSAAADLLAAAAIPVGAAELYTTAEYALSALALVWLVRACAAVTGLSGARAAAAVVPALLGAAAFAFSLLTLGLISPEVFHLLLMM
ncbi:MAG: hypothetical protein NDI60_01325 [Elusimicrobiales bacterium]|nr:hypothetical protein [Elusimicrobiales bacterium]